MPKLIESDGSEEIRQMGREDFLAGESRDDSPFLPLAPATKLWREGWDQAARFPLLALMEYENNNELHQ